jgi:hypothetical protein
LLIVLGIGLSPQRKKKEKKKKKRKIKSTRHLPATGPQKLWVHFDIALEQVAVTLGQLSLAYLLTEAHERSSQVPRVQTKNLPVRKTSNRKTNQRATTYKQPPKGAKKKKQKQIRKEAGNVRTPKRTKKKVCRRAFCLVSFPPAAHPLCGLFFFVFCFLKNVRWAQFPPLQNFSTKRGHAYSYLFFFCCSVAISEPR